ncbi:MAG: aspartate aminotransferase family protein [Bacteriovoracaceae bacterium]|nr:aspartate aminotransferase family protein [Bacteriovoracaceae bacterium]
MDKVFPEHGIDKDKVLLELDSLSQDDPDFKRGRTWGLVYYAGEEHHQFLKDVHSRFASQNALNSMAFKSLKRMESDVVRMSVEIFNGDEQCVGTMTSGGTESIMMAVKTYRDRARKLKPWILHPEMIVPDSVHVAFDKAGKYFDVKMIHAPLNSDFRVDTKWVSKKINRNTIAIVGSAPQYPHGVVDDIAALSVVAVKKKVPLHVDACLGGFLLPFLEMAGENIPTFDFRLPGVTSISADVHKYGFSAKGASVILYRNMQYMKHQFFIYENWPGGIFASPAMLGTRSGGPIAAAWATLKTLGIEGFKNNAETIQKISKELIRKIEDIPEMKIVGKPVASVFAYTTKDPKINIYTIADFLNEKGWHVDRNQKPESLHAMVTLGHEQYIDEFVTDLKAAVEYTKAHPEKAKEGNAAMYGMIAKIPVRSMIKSSVMKMMEQMYSAEGKLPDGNTKPDEDSFEALAQRVGLQFLDIKDSVDAKISNIKSKFKEKISLRK